MKDEFGSYHRIISKKDYINTLSYYQNHLYIDGEFETKDYISKLTKEEFNLKILNDEKRVNDIFETLYKHNFLYKNNVNILDIGCGYGGLIKKWVEKGYGKGYGVDISTIAKEVAQRYYEGILIDIVDVSAFNNMIIRDDISVIFALDIVEHLLDVGDFLSAIFSNIKCGTNVVIMIPVIGSDFNVFELSNYKYLYPTRHLHLFTPQGFEMELERTGFKLVGKELLKGNSKYLTIVEKCKN